MKSSITSLLFSVIIFFQSYGQVKEASKNISEQATKMGSSFVSGDYKAFSKYNNKKMLQVVGGEAKMIAALVQTVANMKTKGMSFKSITFDEPSAIVKSGKDLQATIAQHTELNTSPGRAISTSTLIALSTDNGVTWTFLDTLNKDMVMIKAYTKFKPLDNPTTTTTTSKI